MDSDESLIRVSKLKSHNVEVYVKSAETAVMIISLLGFCLVFKRRYDGLRRSNRIGEDDNLEQKKQIKVEQISRLYSRLMLRPVDYIVDWEDTEEDISISRLIH